MFDIAFIQQFNKELNILSNLPVLVIHNIAGNLYVILLFANENSSTRNQSRTVMCPRLNKQ